MKIPETVLHKTQFWISFSRFQRSRNDVIRGELSIHVLASLKFEFGCTRNARTGEPKLHCAGFSKRRRCSILEFLETAFFL